jgi:WD40 repeat protein
MRIITLLLFPFCLAVAAPALAREEIAASGVLTDSLGDALPRGAIARLGALRFRHDGLTLGLAYTQDGKYLVGSSFSGVIVWDAASGKERLRVSDGIALKFAVSPDGATLAAWVRRFPSVERTLEFWDLRTGKYLPRLSFPENKRNLNIGQFSFTADGKQLVINTMDDGKAVVFDTNLGKVRSFGGGRALFYSLAVSPDSKSVAVATRLVNPAAPNAGYGVEIWDLVKGSLSRVIHRAPADKGGGYAKALTFSHDGTVLAFGTNEGVLLFNVVTGQRAAHIDIKLGQDYQLALTPDVKTLLACDAHEWKVHVFDVAKGKLVHTLEPHKSGYRPACWMALSPDGKTVALGTVWNALQLWDVATGKELFTEYKGHFSQSMAWRFHPTVRRWPPVAATARFSFGTQPRGGEAPPFRERLSPWLFLPRVIAWRRWVRVLARTLPCAFGT